jgi:hypothetical protein
MTPLLMSHGTWAAVGEGARRSALSVIAAEQSRRTVRLYY